MVLVDAPEPRVRTSETDTALVQASFDRWRAGTGGLFELPAPEADLTIIGSSPLAKTYPSKQRLICWHLSEPVHLRTARSGLRPWLGGL